MMWPFFLIVTIPRALAYIEPHKVCCVTDMSLPCLRGAIYFSRKSKKREGEKPRGCFQLISLSFSSTPIIMNLFNKKGLLMVFPTSLPIPTEGQSPVGSSGSVEENLFNPSFPTLD